MYVGAKKVGRREPGGLIGPPGLPPDQRMSSHPLPPSLQDDSTAMDFVTAAANLRAIAFGIPQKSRFDVKCKLSN